MLGRRGKFLYKSSFEFNRHDYFSIRIDKNIHFIDYSAVQYVKILQEYGMSLRARV